MRLIQVYGLMVVVVVLALAVAGCGAQATPTTGAPQATPVSTADQVPTPQATATQAGQPTATAAATAQPTAASAERPPIVFMSSTIGPIDAGIVGALEDAYYKKTGVTIRHTGAGTGATLDMAKGGAYDMVMVHARALEDKFVADGYGVDRRDLMFNDFVILGPASDPAGVKGETKAPAAFAKIANSKALFATRGDTSGTAIKEMEIWDKAGIKPSGDWYVTFPQGATGNAPTTRFANEKQAYVLMDRATYITLKSEISLQLLMEKDTDLLNYIAVIKVNPAKFPKVNADGAAKFVDWLVSEEAQQIIKTFGVEKYGESLFFPNSAEWHAAHPET